MKIVRILLSISFLFSCNGETGKTTPPAAIKESQKDTTHRGSTSNDRQKEVVEFISYSNDDDYVLVNIKHGNTFRSLIYGKMQDMSFLRGDTIEIEWKSVAAHISVEGNETTGLVITAKKIKDGSVSVFRKNYGKEIKYTWPVATDYTRSYLDELYMVAEYYLSRSDNELLKLNIKARNDLTYSIEQQTKENKVYTVLGIASELGDHTSMIQWLYYDKDHKKLYEYDLPNDTLIEFK